MLFIVNKFLLTLFTIFISALSFIVLHGIPIAEAGCRDSKPGSAPVITSITTGNESATLTWTEAQDPVSYYLIAYGTSPTNLEYGNTNIGPRGTTTYTVNYLTNGVRYYFRVRAGNGCRPGNFSHTKSVKVGVTDPTYRTINLSITKPNILGESTTKAPSRVIKKPIVQKTQEKPPSTCFVCNGSLFLIVEIIGLIGFFSLCYFIPKFYLKPGLSFLIPAAVYVLYLVYQHNCVSNSFTCKYFLLLAIVIYVLIGMVYKQFVINRYERK